MEHPLGQASPQSPTYKGLGPISEVALKGECHNLRTGGTGPCGACLSRANPARIFFADALPKQAGPLLQPPRLLRLAALRLAPAHQITHKGRAVRSVSAVRRRNLHAQSPVRVSLAGWLSRMSKARPKAAAPCDDEQTRRPAPLRLGGSTRPIARLAHQGATESASTPKSGCAMPSHTAILTLIGLPLGAIWKISDKISEL